MKAGYYKDDMDEISNEDDVLCAAVTFAEINHQIDEGSDMTFTIYVEDNGGDLFEVKMFTEYNPVYDVESSTKVEQER